MNLRSLVFFLVLAGWSSIAFSQSDASRRIYELRSYQSESGRQSDVLKLMAKEGLGLMEKHHIQLVGAWVPIDSKDERVFTLLSYSDKAAADSSAKSFQEDPDWKEAIQKSLVNGKKPVKSFHRIFLTANDYSPILNTKETGTHVYELRTYIASSGNLEALNNRFRNHTLKLFEKHGMTNVIYWSVLDGEALTCSELLEAASPLDKAKADVDGNLPATGNSLVYFLAHSSTESAAVSFDNFRNDPAWTEAKKQSETDAGGALTVTDGVKSLFLKPVEFSPLK